MIKINKKLQLAIIFLAGLVLLLLWMQGTFRSRVGPGTVSVPVAEMTGQLYTVAFRTVLDWREAPGIVASKEQPQVSSQILGRILEVRVASGDRVNAGQVLAIIDDAEVRSRLGQARDHLSAMQAQYRQAQSDFHRFKNLVGRKVVPVREFDAVKARFETIRAQVQQAIQAVNEAQANFRYATVVSPAAGLVAEKMVDVGDLATPGRPLFTIYDPLQMRLEAQVGEQYSQVLQPGASTRISIPSLNLELPTAIDEVVAQAASSSRTFLVKATLPVQPDLRPGMFGRLYFDGRQRQALLIPTTAVRDIGQLEMVQVAQTDGVRLRQVKTGKRYGAEVEILSGLQAGEQIVLSFPEK
ncbi:efflux RND transporter periplasmic adaptor subunit [Desulfobacca acetoxidans]